MADEKHASPSGLELPNPKNSEDHPDVAPIYVSPEDIKKEATQDPYSDK